MDNHWAWAIYGIILYNFVNYVIKKDSYEHRNKRFSFRLYTKQVWDSWAWSLLCVPLIVAYGEAISPMVTKYLHLDSVDLPHFIYLFAGALSELIYYAVRKFKDILLHFKNLKS